MTNLFQLKSIDEAWKIIQKSITFIAKEAEEINVLDSLGRVLAMNVVSEMDLPDFSRSTMDGYAVRAADSYGASEAIPAMLQIAGEILMGQPAHDKLKPGQAIKIPTGGMMPEGADAVVMVEHTEQAGADLALILRPVAPGENVVQKGEDVSQGIVVLKVGQVIRPQDMGAMAGLGYIRCKVVSRPKIAIISTGDEIVEPNNIPGLGQIRDVNSYSLFGIICQAGGQPKHYGIINDKRTQLKEVVNRALAENDVVVISGGSSVGTRDVTADVIDEIGTPGVLIHGVSVKPGKPTVFGVVNNKPVLGLPGHPASAMILADLFLVPMIRGFLGLGFSMPERLIKRAKMGRSMASASGRSDYIRVALQENEEGLLAMPVLGKSGLIRTMINAQGVVIIPSVSQGIEAGQEVEVIMF